MTVAVISTRFSPRPGALECDSCEKQEERCMAYCRERGYLVVASHSDKAVSGGDADRPGLDAAIQEVASLVRAGHGDVVLVMDSVSRTGRDMLVSLTIRHRVESAGGRIEYADGSTQSDTPEGRLIGNILAAFAAYERDRLRYSVSRGLKRRQANGEWFGKPPVGFMLDPDSRTRLVPNEQEQAGMRLVRELSDRGKSVPEIAKAVGEAHGLFRGRPWSERTIRRIIASARKAG